MNRSEVVNQLSLFLGLDDETINAVLVPQLNSLTSRAEIQDYLTGLLGSDRSQASFTRSYAESRFPITQPPSSTTAKPSSSSNAKANEASSLQNRKLTPSVPAFQPQSQPRPSPQPTIPIQQSTASSSGSRQISRGPSPLPNKPAMRDAFSEAVQEQLFELERKLRYTKGEGKRIACFCQATQHPVSPTSPMCQKCLLVICDLNVPYNSPCPSCANANLASTTALTNYRSQLERQRDTVIQNEVERLRLESEEVERERRAIQFPTLEGSAGFGGQSSTVASGYASKAGGGLSTADHQRRIDQLYKDAQDREKADRQRGERRVLTLNTKTHKVRVQTTKPKASTAAAKGQSLAKKQQLDGSEWEDKRMPYIDEDDDGVRKDTVHKVKTNRVQGEWPPPSKYVYEPAVDGKSIQDDNDEVEEEDEKQSVA